MMVTFSVLLCVNKQQPWLVEAMESVLRQDDGDFEFLIAANACSDELWEELNHITSGDPRVRLFRTSIGQLAFNLNFLADHSHAEYLVRMDADDVSEINRIRRLRQALMETTLDILGSAVLLIDEEGRQIGRMDFPESAAEIAHLLPTRTVFCHPAVVIRRSFLISLRGYLGGYASEDTDLWLRAFRAGARMQNLSEPLLRYRIHNEQSLTTGNGYAEVAGHWLREWLIKPSYHNFKGIILAVGKSFFKRFLPGIRRYQL